MKEMICEVVPGITLDGVVVSEFFRPVKELVRCKDCKHRPIKTGEDDDDIEFPDAKCICANPDDDWYSWYPDDDWFCGNGERKDGGDE